MLTSNARASCAQSAPHQQVPRGATAARARRDVVCLREQILEVRPARRRGTDSSAEQDRVAGEHPQADAASSTASASGRCGPVQRCRASAAQPVDRELCDPRPVPAWHARGRAAARGAPTPATGRAHARRRRRYHRGASADAMPRAVAAARRSGRSRRPAHDQAQRRQRGHNLGRDHAAPLIQRPARRRARRLPRGSAQSSSRLEAGRARVDSRSTSYGSKTADRSMINTWLMAVVGTPRSGVSKTTVGGRCGSSSNIR